MRTPRATVIPSSHPPGVGTVLQRLGLLLVLQLAAACSGTSSQPQPSATLFDSLFAEAEDVYFSGQYDSARVLLSHLRTQAQARQEGSAEPEKAIAADARATTWLGLAAWRLGDYEEARRLGEEALALKLEHGLQDQVFRSYNALGLLAWNENRLSEARELYTRAIASADEAGGLLEAASATGNLALVQTELGEFADARQGFLSMRAIVSELGETRVEANALTNLGMLEIRVGNPNAALPYLKDARAKYDSIDYPTGVQSALGQLGTAYTALGEPQVAFAVLDSALALAREQGLRQEEASNLEALAELYREAGDFQRAIPLYDEAKVINAELGLDVETGADLRGEAEIQVHLGDLDEAHYLAEEALAIHRSAGARLDELMDLLLLAEIQDEMKATLAVQSTLHLARTLAGELDARIARTEMALTEARIAHRNGAPEEVLEVTRDASRDLARGGFSSEWEAYLLRSRAFHALGQPDSALSAGRRALAAVERVRRGFGSSMLRSAYVSDKEEVYSHLVSILLEQGRVTEAFEVSDAARGRALIERMAMAGVDASSSSTTAALREGETILREIDQLVESINYLEEFPQQERNADQRAELNHLYRRIDSLRSAHEELSIRVAETDPASAALLGLAPAKVTEIQSALLPGQLLVEYLVSSADSVLVFAVTPSEVRHFGAPIRAEDLTSRVRLARGLITQGPDPKDRVRRVLAGLHEALLGPVLESGVAGSATEIIFVPHGVVSYLPFAALYDQATGRYLAQDYLVRVLPSAGALPALLAKHPDHSVPPGSASVLAPFTHELPGTLDEARAVGREMPHTRRHLGDEATERRLRQALGASDVVHVATHGIMNARNPMFSRLELARGNGDPTDDGRFEVHELFAVTVRSSVVFLSGCDTGAGPSGSTSFALGEDFATLAQAFLYAGARNVIATLWPVEDAGAAAFAEEFYRALKAASPAAALATAQRSMLAREEYGPPYYWAAYQLVGDDFAAAAPNAASTSNTANSAHRSLPGSVQHR